MTFSAIVTLVSNHWLELFIIKIHIKKRHWYLHYHNIQQFFTAIQVVIWLYLLYEVIPRNYCPQKWSYPWN